MARSIADSTTVESVTVQESGILVLPSSQRRLIGTAKKRTITAEPKRSRQIGPVKRSSREAPPLSAPTYGLIQERITHNLYFLVLQAILWNQTTGRQARPVLEQLTTRYPSPSALANASLHDLTAMLQPIGLHNIRAARCIALGKRWCEQPPDPRKRYVRKGYPVQSGADDLGLGWEIAHLPGVGPYALESYRIFHRDELRGLAKDWLGGGALEESFEPEWKRVVPTDKELKAYLKWRWLKEGFEWDERTGEVKKRAKLEAR